MNAGPAIRAALRGSDPSPEQWEAITHPPVPLAIIAGAGSGKTAVMAARIVWFVEEGHYRAAEILGLTFTNKAAQELEERIVAAFTAMEAPPKDQPLVATYNSFADKLVRDHGVRIGIDPESGLLQKAQAWQLLIEESDKLEPFEDIDTRSLSTIVARTLEFADECSNHLVSPERIAEEERRIVEDATRFHEDVVATAKQRIELAKVVRLYMEAKRRAKRIDFGDQVTQAVEVLEHFPQVALELRERYPAILLDEYQDTNVAQRRLLQTLAPAGHNVTAVGDARQNIFQWRGSTLFNLIDFPKKHFLREGDQPHDYHSLSTNYRSGSKILSVANHIIEQVPAERRPGKPLVPDPVNGEGGVHLRVLSDQYAEAGFIAGEILRLHGGPVATGRPSAEWSDFAILVRRKSHIPAIYSTLKDHDIPVEVIGLSGLLQVPEIVDTMSWLRLLAEPGPTSNRWLARILLGPRFRVHYRDLAILARWATAHNIELADAKKESEGDGGLIVEDETQFDPEDVAFSLLEALDHLDEIDEVPPEARRRLTMARDEIKRLRRKTGGPLLELVRSVISDVGITESIDASTRADAEASRRNLTNFLGVVASFAPVSGEPSLGAFLAYLDAAEDVEETLDLATEVVGNSVKLMTVHQAKGLEFEVVFVPAVASRRNEEGEYVESIFPDTRTTDPTRSYWHLPPSVREDRHHLPAPWTSDDQGRQVPRKEYREDLKARAIEDERRLFYVALTRAKQLLYVSAAWWYERHQKERGPSEFFNEVVEVAGVEHLGEDERPEENPLQALLAEVAVWPPAPPHSVIAERIFPNGYPETLEQLMSGNISNDEIFARLDGSAGALGETQLNDYREVGAMLHRAVQERGATPEGQGLPRSLSATDSARLANQRITASELLRPIPERPTAARRIGTEVHRWIEEQARGLTGLADEEALDLPAEHVEQSTLATFRSNFAEMGYPDRRLAELDTGEPMAEIPFAMKVGDRLVRGRIDAVYETANGDGGLEIVDFKTGREPVSAIPRSPDGIEGDRRSPGIAPDMDQLLIYAAALTRLGLDIRGPLTLTYAYLSTGRAESRTISRDEASGALDRLASALSR
jgi:DNA helicase-2/ATP-dependent DNA helicase PcrA